MLASANESRETLTPGTSYIPPPAFGRFRLLHQIGAGVLGPVFRTHDPEGERLVAVKAFAIDLTPEQAVELAALLDRLRFTELPGSSVAAVIAAGVEDGVAYLAQQYVAGESLDAAVRQYGPAPPADAVRLISHVAGGLDAAARAGLFHGALHPRDVLVTPGETHVTGLGVASALEAVGHRAPIRRPYAAPERENGLEWGAAADIHALAAISYEVLTGRRALPGTEQPLPGLSDVKAHDGAALHEAIVAALDPDPARRPATASDFAASYTAALTGGGRGAGQGPDRPTRQRRSKARAAKLPGLDDPLGPAAAGAGVDEPLPVDEPILVDQPAPTDEPAEPRLEFPLAAGFEEADVAAVVGADQPVDASIGHAASDWGEVTEPEVVTSTDHEIDASLEDEADIWAAAAGSTEALAIQVGDPKPEPEETSELWARAAFDALADGEPAEAEPPTPVLDDATGEADIDREAAHDRVDSELAGIPSTFTPDAADFRREGFGPDLTALSQALEGGGEARRTEHEDLATPAGDGLAASESAPAVDESAGEAEGTLDFGLEEDDAGRLDDEPTPAPDRPRPPNRETIDDYREPGTLVSAPPVPKALDLGGAGRHQRHHNYPSGAGDAGRRRYIVAALIAVAFVLLLLVAFWSGAFRVFLGSPAALAPSAARPEEPRGGTPAPEPVAPEGGPPASQAAPLASPDATSPPVVTSQVGEIRVISSPSRADVFVNGERRGMTPRNLRDLPLGTYTIRVLRPGYSPQERVVTISPDSPTSRLSFSLARLREVVPPARPVPKRPAAKAPDPPARSGTSAPKAQSPDRGSISVETRPGGVRVIIDGRAVGRSPLVVPDVAPGKHEVRFELDGYRPWVTTVTLTPGQRLRVTASLERAPAR